MHFRQRLERNRKILEQSLQVHNFVKKLATYVHIGSNNFVEYLRVMQDIPQPESESLPQVAHILAEVMLWKPTRTLHIEIEMPENTNLQV